MELLNSFAFADKVDTATLRISPGYHIRRLGGLAPKFASEILVGAPKFASKIINDNYPKFYPLNFRYDPRMGTFPKTFASSSDRASQVFPLIW